MPSSWRRRRCGGSPLPSVLVDHIALLARLYRTTLPSFCTTREKLPFEEVIFSPVLISGVLPLDSRRSPTVKGSDKTQATNTREETHPWWEGEPMTRPAAEDVEIFLE